MVNPAEVFLFTQAMCSDSLKNIKQRNLSQQEFITYAPPP
ncbi:Uncharacterized protein dnm_092280 [Desulfonema magnum]|uniref:Uncharacterized protein n=1 Tax=Desulfonema magnum TaxID=45655 RepID=A0A975GTJ0_9BACT|nr:Uncharacterized protein dnm_092280 [Desulfonema magnum]